MGKRTNKDSAKLCRPQKYIVYYN